MRAIFVSVGVSWLLALGGCAVPQSRASGPLGATDQDAIAAAEAAIDRAHIEVQVADGYRWHRTEDGNSVQFGRPETDDRSLRIDCHEGQLLVAGPANTDAAEGSTTTALFKNGQRRGGSISYLGDGPNFVIPLAVDDTVVATLMTDGHIAIDTDSTVVRVPGAGAQPLLRELIARCRSLRP